MTISINLLVLKASKLDRDFRGKSASAKYSCIKRWMAKKNLTLWAVMHESQKIPDETIAEAKSFVSKQGSIVDRSTLRLKNGLQTWTRLEFISPLHLVLLWKVVEQELIMASCRQVLQCV